MSGVFNVGFIAITLIFLIGTIALYAWLWRGKFIGYTGMRLEESRRSVLRSIRMSLPVAGVLTASASLCALDLMHLSRVWHAFWSGFLAASLLFLAALVNYNAVAEFRRLQTERRQKERGQA